MSKFALKPNYMVHGIPALVMPLPGYREAFIVYNPNSDKFESGVCSARNEFDFAEYDTLLQAANMQPHPVSVAELANYEAAILAIMTE